MKNEKLSYHGRLSSASTGKFAALRLPFAVLSEEKRMSLEGAGTSMSISSSKSDMLAAVITGREAEETCRNSKVPSAT